MNEHGTPQADATVSQTGAGTEAQIPTQEQTEAGQQQSQALERPVFTWFALPDRAGPLVPDLSAEAGNGGTPPVPPKPRTVDFTFLAELCDLPSSHSCQHEEGS